MSSYVILVIRCHQKPRTCSAYGSSPKTLPSSDAMYCALDTPNSSRRTKPKTRGAYSLKIFCLVSSSASVRISSYASFLKGSGRAEPPISRAELAISGGASEMESRGDGISKSRD